MRELKAEREEKRSGKTENRAAGCLLSRLQGSRLQDLNETLVGGPSTKTRRTDRLAVNTKHEKIKNLKLQLHVSKEVDTCLISRRDCWNINNSIKLTWIS